MLNCFVCKKELLVGRQVKRMFSALVKPETCKASCLSECKGGSLISAV